MAKFLMAKLWISSILALAFAASGCSSSSSSLPFAGVQKQTFTITGSGGTVSPGDNDDAALVVSGVTGRIINMRVHVSVHSTYGADVALELEAPTTKRIPLTRGNGLSIQNAFHSVTWDERSSISVSDMTFVSGATYDSLSPEGRLSIFFGDDPNGTWYLNMENMNFSGNDISFYSFSIEFETIPNIALPSSSLLSQTYTGPTPIGNNTSLVIPFNINSDRVVCGVVGLEMDITHQRNDDLVLILRSPSGTESILSSYNGGSGSNGYSDVIFAEAVTTTAVSEATFPEDLLSPETGFTRFIGEAAQGQWRLIVQDTDSPNTGSVNSVTLYLRTCD